MRRKLQFLAGVLAALATAVGVQGVQQQTQNQREVIREARHTAAEMLEDRGLAIRIYPDPQNDPGRSTLVTIPIHDLGGNFSAIEKVHPSISESAYILIRAEDQRDKGVAMVLDRYVCLRAYTPQYRQTIWFLDNHRPCSTSWTFFDALGTPMAGASVVVEIGPSSDLDAPPIRLHSATLDDQGRLPRRLAAAGALTMRVEHPDYGLASVRAIRGREDPAGIYVVPVVPRDSEALSSCVQGTVTDDEGQPVAGVPVSLARTGAREANGCYERLFFGRAITNEHGWFSLCLPALAEDFMLEDLPAPGTRYEIAIEPPPGLNLRRLGGIRSLMVSAGTHDTFVLTRMTAELTFHTFSFEYFDGPVTAQEELSNIVLTLRRDERTWIRLRYDQFKDGYALPPGELAARTMRRHGPFSFGEVELTSASPEHIVFRSGPPIAYRGRVVESGTGKPMAGAFVLANHSLARTDPCSMKPEQWQDLAAQAHQAAAGSVPDEILYRAHDRVTMTDTDGVFEILLVPATNERLSFFSALAPGYSLAPTVQPPASRPSPEGIVEVPMITLAPLSEQYFPHFRVEDESGPVTDPEKLDAVQLRIRRGQYVSGRSFSRFVQERQFQPGIYHAEAVWDGRHYLFETVDLTAARPDVVVFKPRQIRPTQVTYQGFVINAVTGVPIPDALVIFDLSGPTHDASDVEPQQWAGIRALGPNPDPNDLALAPILASFGYHSRPDAMAFALTDRDGSFRLRADHKGRLPRTSLTALAEDFVGVSETLTVRPGARDAGTPTLSLRFEPDADGVVTLPTALSLYPAARVSFCPMLPDPGSANGAGPRVSLHWSAMGAEPAPWLTELAAMTRRFSLRPNIEQTVYVPAGMTLSLIARPDSRSGILPVYLGQVRLEQGQTARMGHVEFTTGVEVIVRVTDPTGAPVADMTVYSTDPERRLRYMDRRTNRQGMARLNVPAHTTGCVYASFLDPVTRERIEEHVPYRVGSQEEAAREILIRLSDAFAQQAEIHLP